MFHNSPKKFPQFFKPSVVFPMGLLLSRCKLMSPSCRCHCFKHSRWIQPTEPRQRHGCKSSSEPWHTRHVFPSIHAMEVTEVPWKGKGVKMQEQKCPPVFSKRWNQHESTFFSFFFGGGLRLTSIHESIYPSWFIWFVCCLGFCSLHLGEFWWPWRFLHVWKDMDTWSRT